MDPPCNGHYCDQFCCLFYRDVHCKESAFDDSVNSETQVSVRCGAAVFADGGSTVINLSVEIVVFCEMTRSVLEPAISVFAPRCPHLYFSTYAKFRVHWFESDSGHFHRNCLTKFEC